MGSGGNELPLGRELRMNPTRSESAGSERPKYAQQSEPQPIASTGGSVRVQPAMELPRDKDANKPAKAERKAASKAVKVEIRGQARQRSRKRNTAKNEPQRETEAATEAPNVPQTVEVGIHFVCTRGFYQDLCLSRLRKSRNRGTL